MWFWGLLFLFGIFMLGKLVLDGELKGTLGGKPLGRRDGRPPVKLDADGPAAPAIDPTRHLQQPSAEALGLRPAKFSRGRARDPAPASTPLEEVPTPPSSPRVVAPPAPPPSADLYAEDEGTQADESTEAAPKPR